MFVGVGEMLPQNPPSLLAALPEFLGGGARELTVFENHGTNSWYTLKSSLCPAGGWRTKAPSRWQMSIVTD